MKFLLIMQPDLKLCEDFKPPAVWARPEGTNHHLFLIRPPSCNPSREMSFFCARVYYLLFDACVPLTQYVETRCLKGCYCRYIQRREDNHRSAPRCKKSTTRFLLNRLCFKTRRNSLSWTICIYLLDISLSMTLHLIYGICSVFAIMIFICSVKVILTPQLFSICPQMGWRTFVVGKRTDNALTFHFN